MPKIIIDSRGMVQEEGLLGVSFGAIDVDLWSSSLYLDRDKKESACQRQSLIHWVFEQQQGAV